MSLLFFPDRPNEKLSDLISGVHRSVQNVIGGELRENEIFLSDKKISGILTECVADPDGIKSCIAGVGVYANLLTDAVHNKYPTRNSLASAIAENILASAMPQRF